MASDTAIGGSVKEGPTPSYDLSVDIPILREESREQTELLRSLVRMLLPKVNDDGPTFDELIAALVAQQRDIILAIRQVQSDVRALHKQRDADRSEIEHASHTNGNGNGNGNGAAST